MFMRFMRVIASVSILFLLLPISVLLCGCGDHPVRITAPAQLSAALARALTISLSAQLVFRPLAWIVLPRHTTLTCPAAVLPDAHLIVSLAWLNILQHVSDAITVL